MMTARSSQLNSIRTGPTHKGGQEDRGSPMASGPLASGYGRILMIKKEKAARLIFSRRAAQSNKAFSLVSD